MKMQCAELRTSPEVILKFTPFFCAYALRARSCAMLTGIGTVTGNYIALARAVGR